MEEIFKDVIGYEGVLQIGNKGNFKRLARNVTKTNGSVLKIVESTRPGFKIGKTGYAVPFSISVNNKVKVFNHNKMYPIYFGPRNEEEKEEIMIKDSPQYKDVEKMREIFKLDEKILKELKTNELKFYAKQMKLSFEYLVAAVCLVLKLQ